MRIMEKSDEREICKYGSKCYQKNSAHHARFQHPLQSPVSSDDELVSHARKKQKLTEENTNFHNISEASDTEDDDHSHDLNPSASKLEVPDRRNLIFVDQLDGGIRNKLKVLYVVEFPEDILSFYSFCKSVCSRTPKTALRDIDLELVGPFDLISGVIKSCTRDQIILHYRYFFDPPEFYTILKATNSDFHYGYYFDEPDKPPVFIASNNPKEGCIIKIHAANIFGAVSIHINNFLKACDPFKQMRVKKLQSSLVKWAKENKFTLDPSTPSIRTRNIKSNTKTFHGAGIVVPCNEKTEVGYRPLAENDKTLKELFEKIANSETENERSMWWSKIQHVITYAEIATDECDFGTSLELGIDMFCQGHECFHRTTEQLMTTSYSLLGRKHFADVIRIHLKDRIKDVTTHFACTGQNN